MARPVVAATAELLYEALGALTAQDGEDNDWELLRLCDALCSGTFEDIYQLVAEIDDRPGWQVLFDPDECPAVYLPYLAQFAGVELEPDLTEEQQRDKIKLPEGFLRGTRDALIQAIQRTLTGTKHVAFIERYTGSAYQLAVRTQTAETPDEAVTLAAILSQKPVGIVLDYDSITGATYDEVEAAYDDYDDLEASNADYSAVLLLPA